MLRADTCIYPGGKYSKFSKACMWRNQLLHGLYCSAVTWSRGWGTVWSDPQGSRSARHSCRSCLGPLTCPPPRWRIGHPSQLGASHCHNGRSVLKGTIYCTFHESLRPLMDSLISCIDITLVQLWNTGECRYFCLASLRFTHPVFFIVLFFSACIYFIHVFLYTIFWIYFLFSSALSLEYHTVWWHRYS